MCTKGLGLAENQVTVKKVVTLGLHQDPSYEDQLCRLLLLLSLCFADRLVQCGINYNAIATWPADCRQTSIFHSFRAVLKMQRRNGVTSCNGYIISVLYNQLFVGAMRYQTVFFFEPEQQANHGLLGLWERMVPIVARGERGQSANQNTVPHYHIQQKRKKKREHHIARTAPRVRAYSGTVLAII